jgi:hypothetical protein
MFRPAAALGRPRQGVSLARGVGKRRKPSEGRRSKAAARWLEAEKRLVAALGKGPLRGLEVVKAAGLNRTTLYQRILPRMLRAKKIERVPGGGRMGFQLPRRTNGG